MFMSRARLLPKAVYDRSMPDNMGSSYNIHKLVWSLFANGSEATRNFLYHYKSDDSLPTFYILSEKEPDDRNDIWDINIKPYDPILKSGQRLAFSLRANPIVAKRDESGKQHRHDVVMHAKYQLNKDNPLSGRTINIAEIVQDKGVEWLVKKSEQNGFSLSKDQVRADGYRSHTFLKPNGGHKVSLSTIDFSGVLTVDDPALFKEALFKGIGPAKGFGCGMLLVRPIG